MKNDELVELVTYNNEVEYGKIESLLNENNIKFMNRSFHDTALDGIYTYAHGLGKIFVYKNDIEKAKEILKENDISL